jgi:hypothetical protein
MGYVLSVLHLVAVTWLLVVTWLFDGLIGALANDPAKSYGPFAFVVLNARAVGWLLRE